MFISVLFAVLLANRTGSIINYNALQLIVYPLCPDILQFMFCNGCIYVHCRTNMLIYSMCSVHTAEQIFSKWFLEQQDCVKHSSSTINCKDDWILIETCGAQGIWIHITMALRFILLPAVIKSIHFIKVQLCLCSEVCSCCFVTVRLFLVCSDPTDSLLDVAHLWCCFISMI